MGTATWAAATSGPGAFPMLLLACALARIWNASQATSLWVDIVESRKQQIRRDCQTGDSSEFALMQAARAEVERSELAEWDASARAWLLTADTCCKTQQTQLMLIVNNLDTSISGSMKAYESVVESLKTALISMEGILRGMPQRATDGAFLLGLSAWHLYPDLIVHGPETKTVSQRDSLIPPGALVTLGLQFDVKQPRGIFWSLPLAHLRFYGSPVVQSRSSGCDASRILADELMFVRFGSLIKTWIHASTESDVAVKWFMNLHGALTRAACQKTSSANSDGSLACAQRLLPSPG